MTSYSCSNDFHGHSYSPLCRVESNSEDPHLVFSLPMFRVRIHIWLKALHCASPLKSLFHLPGTCEPTEGANLSSGSSAWKTPGPPPSNFTYTCECEEPQTCSPGPETDMEEIQATDIQGPPRAQESQENHR
ncbi:hypothetical protein CRENBAI_005770 [Crenichthys baileyi]|uniref:Uncharacterized protein n=1 Tax=Crenichthys baileyi TaxID=28760 RepID=A0AAV9S858_9TELE